MDDIKRLEARTDNLVLEVDELKQSFSALQHQLDRSEDRAQDMRDLLVGLREELKGLTEAMRDSVAAVHKRVDDLKDADTRAAGKEEGRSEARAQMIKWISGIVALIAIVGYMNGASAEARPAHKNQEAVIYDRRSIG